MRLLFTTSPPAGNLKARLLCHFSDVGIYPALSCLLLTQHQEGQSRGMPWSCGLQSNFSMCRCRRYSKDVKPKDVVSCNRSPTDLLHFGKEKMGGWATYLNCPNQLLYHLAIECNYSTTPIST